jgi:hypothetical protein
MPYIKISLLKLLTFNIDIITDIVLTLFLTLLANNLIMKKQLVEYKVDIGNG